MTAQRSHTNGGREEEVRPYQNCIPPANSCVKLSVGGASKHKTWQAGRHCWGGVGVGWFKKQKGRSSLFLFWSSGYCGIKLAENLAMREDLRLYKEKFAGNLIVEGDSRGFTRWATRKSEVSW